MFLEFSLYLILIFCLLDIFTPFHQINLQILELFSGEEKVSLLISRFDEGLRRPFPFTKEPSHVAKYILIAMPAWFVLNGWKSYKKYFIGAFIFLIVIRSPIIVGVMGLGLAFILLDKSLRKGYLRFFTTRMLLLCLIVIVAFFTYQTIGNRLTNILHGTDSSTLMRVIRPIYILKVSLLNYPFFGVGIGNTELLTELYFQNYGNFMYNTALGEGYTISSLLAPIAFFGLIGSSIHMIFLVKFLRYKRKYHSLIVLVLHYILLSISMAALLTLNYWVYLFIIFRVYSFSEKNDNIIK